MQKVDSTSAAARLEIEGRVGVIVIDNPPVNAASIAVRRGLLDALGMVGERADIDAAILIGAGRTFIAGSDLKEFDAPLATPEMPTVIAAIEACSKPVVAAIHGVALGGGFEVALGCDARIATADALVGLPEVKLGMIPGAGGTQRLPRLVGISKAIEMIVAGRRVKAPEALSLGAIDAVADGDLRGAAIAYAIGLNGKKRRLSEVAVPGEDTADIEKAVAAALRGSKGQPAIPAAIEAVRIAADTPFLEGLRKERATFQTLRVGPEARALRYVFFAEREATRVPDGARPRKLGKVGVIGLGTMGRGIAAAFALAGLEVLISELDEQRLAEGLTGVLAVIEGLHRRGQLSDAQSNAARQCVKPVQNLAGMAAADLVLEAIIEDLAIKQDLLGKLDGILGKDAILASNTSYLDVDALAAATSHPDRVAGFHFFSPAHIMRLVEVIRGSATSPEVIATLVALAKRLDKLSIQARSSDGFIGNRILSAYRAQCEFLLEEGAYPEQVDAAITGFGLAMGPFAASDLAGLDIAWRNRQRLAPNCGPGDRYVEIADRLCEMGRLGRKTGAGWYRYGENARTPEVDPVVTALVKQSSVAKGIARRPIDPREIQDRALAAMVNEACLLLGEGVADRPSDVDLVMVNGYGFPAAKGGPLYWASRRPRQAIGAAVDAMVAASGPGVRRAANLAEILDVVQTKN